MKERERLQQTILRILEAGFGRLPDELTAVIRATSPEQEFKELTHFASVCPDLDAFRARLRS